MTSFSIIKKIVVVCSFVTLALISGYSMNSLVFHHDINFQREAHFLGLKIFGQSTSQQNMTEDYQAFETEFKLQDSSTKDAATHNPFSESPNSTSKDEDIPNNQNTKEQIKDTQIPVLSPQIDSYKKSDERMVFATKLLERLKTAQVNVAVLEARLHASDDIDAVLLEIKSLWVAVEENQKKHPSDNSRPGSQPTPTTANGASSNNQDDLNTSNGSTSNDKIKPDTPGQSDEKSNNGSADEKKPNPSDDTAPKSDEVDKDQNPTEKDTDKNVDDVKDKDKDKDKDKTPQNK